MATINSKVSMTPNQDLVQLSGYTIYQYPLKTRFPRLRINNHIYKINDTNYGATSSGLDAMTVQDLQTGNISIIYAGTQTSADIQTDADLILSSGTPQQFKDAESYYKQTKAIYGHIDFVAGNSLGGGLANYVAVRNDVRSVTLDPSILPADVAEPSVHSAAVGRITNYVGGYDPLTRVEVAGGYGGRIPGAKVKVDFGISWLTFLTDNHTGYVGGTDPSSPQDKVSVGVKGTPSAGQIQFMADRQIATDIWTGEPLTADSAGGGQRIKIDKGNMEKLSAALSDPILTDIQSASSYVNSSVRTVEREGARLDDRRVSLQNEFNQMLHSAKGIGPVLDAFDELKVIKPKTSFILEEIYRLNSLPLPEKIIDAVASGLHRITLPLLSIPASTTELFLNMDELTVHVIDLKEKAIPLLFHGVNSHFMDGIVDELKAHYRIVQKNMDRLVHEVSNFRDQTVQVVKIMDQADQGIARSINGAGIHQMVLNIDSSYQSSMLPSSYLKSGMRIRQTQLEKNFQAFSKSAEGDLKPILSVCYRLAGDIIECLEVVSLALGALSIDAYMIRIPFTNWNSRLGEFLSQSKRSINQLISTLENFQAALNHMQQNLPGILMAFKPYIEAALFNGTQYQAVIAYNHASMGVLQDIQLEFRSIVYQLSENQSAAILELEDRAKVIQSDIPTLIEQVKRGTVF